jgi:hypothetical protein
MPDEKPKETKETGTQEVRNKDASLGDVLTGKSDKHGQATNKDGTPVKEVTPKE